MLSPDSRNMSFYRYPLSTYYVLIMEMKKWGQTALVLTEHGAQASPNTGPLRVGPEPSASPHSPRSPTLRLPREHH